MMFFFLVVFGVCLGSFVNAFVWRYHQIREIKVKKLEADEEARQLKDLSIVNGRSMCPHCRHILAAKDLVPIFSWLFLRGRCRYCRSPIEDTPIPEILSGIVFGLSLAIWPYEVTGYGLAMFIVWLLSLTVMLILGLYDARWRLLPTPIVYTLVIFGLVFAILAWLDADMAVSVFRDVLFSVLILWGFLRLIYFISPHMIGFGDVRLAVALGLFAGSPLGAMIVLFSASLMGVLSVLPKILKDGISLKTQLPFGPFLIIGCVIAVLYQMPLVELLDRFLLGL